LDPKNLFGSYSAYITYDIFRDADVKLSGKLRDDSKFDLKLDLKLE